MSPAGRLSHTALALLRDPNRRIFEPALLPIYGVLAFIGAIIGATLLSGAFTAAPEFYAPIIHETATLVLLAYVLRWASFPRFAGPLEIIALSALLGTLTISCSAIFAATGWPRADALLARLDAILFGFDRVALAEILAPQKTFLKVMVWIYDSPLLSWNVLLVSLFATRRIRHAWIAFTSLALASCLALLIFPFFPAYGTPPYSYRFADTLMGLRAGTLRELGPNVMTGIITFPSLHAAGGALLAWGFLPLGRWAWPFVLLNLHVIVSAVVVGGHYLIDIVAGLGVAWLAVFVARCWIDMLMPSDPNGRQDRSGHPRQSSGLLGLIRAHHAWRTARRRLRRAA